MTRPLWFIELIKKNFPNRFFLAKMTNAPVIGKIIDHMLFEGDDIIYLPKDNVVQIKVDKKIQKSDTVLPSQVLEHFIKKSNYHWIMNFCICRDSTNCEDYPIKLGCLFLGEAAKNIDPRLGRKVTKEEALEHVKRCREAGLVHLVGRNKLDTQWLDLSPANKLLTVCNCCPCCCLWKILPSISHRIGDKVTKMPGVSVTVTDQCIGCGTCTRGTCFVDAIKLVREKGKKRAVISGDCRGCGRCVDVCPNEAIELTVDDPEFINKSIDRINSVVDVK
ncbi:MAG: NADH-quinone oxidoreductase subunit I [Candidatus Odinarchaeota archaeon]